MINVYQWADNKMEMTVLAQTPKTVLNFLGSDECYRALSQHAPWFVQRHGNLSQELTDPGVSSIQK